jgi:hypothetical protein
LPRWGVRSLAIRLQPPSICAFSEFAEEAADSGLLSPELCSGYSPGEGRSPDRRENWELVTAEQGKRLLAAAQVADIRGKRNSVMLALLIEWGLTRGELLVCTANPSGCVKNI